MDYNYDGIAERIQKVYSSCSANEQQHLKQILIEMSIHGYSQTLEELWLADFKEVPVSIDEFICNPYYLGESNNNGASVYPFWRDMLRDLFGHGNRYNEICLSGGTRIGKSSTAVTIMAYMLYRLMIYRNPHQYFHKKPVSRFTIAFANLTKDLAEGVAFHEFNTTLQASGWFNDHGSFNKSVQNPIFIPEGNKIDIVPASDAAHILGMQVWACLTMNTEVATTQGVRPIQELVDQQVTVIQYNKNTDSIDFADCTVKLTKYVTETIKIELEDGSFIEGTPEHRLMLSDGTYKRLDELTEEDELMEVEL